MNDTEMIAGAPPEPDELFEDINLKLFCDKYLADRKMRLNVLKSGDVAIINNIPVVARKEVGRNDPCPCGSGNKYKRCCLK